MTPEQMKAFMEWVELKCAQVSAGDKGWAWDEEVLDAREKLYESFEFYTNHLGDLVKD
jgi:hypothetical protein